MKDQRKTEIKVGITVIVAIIIFVWLLGWAKNYDLSSSKKELLIRFDNIAGLEIGDRVTINGIRKGYVDGFTNDGNSVVVKTVLDNDSDIRTDAQFTISMLDLMGGKKIDINPGNNQKQIDFSTIQSGYFSGDISTTMAMLSSVQNDLVDVIKEVKISLTNMNGFLADKNFSQDVKNTFNNLNTLSKQLNELVIENRDQVAKLIKSGNELTETTNNLINENKEGIKENVTKLNELMNNSNNLVLKIDQTISEIKNKENNIGKLMYDESFLKNMTETLKEVKELTKLLNEQLKGEGINVDANIF